MNASTAKLKQFPLVKEILKEKKIKLTGGYPSCFHEGVIFAKKFEVILGF